MTEDNSLALIAGTVLSLLFSYGPGLRQKYDSLSPDYKRLVMLAALAVVTLGLYGASCAGVYDLPFVAGVECTRAGALGLFELFVSALIANQATFLASPTPRA